MSIINILSHLLLKNRVLNNRWNPIICRNLVTNVENNDKIEDFVSMIDKHKISAKKYLIIKDNINILSKLNVENLSNLLGLKVDQIFKWTFDKHNCALIELNDENFLLHQNIRKSFGFSDKSMIKNTKIISINRWPKNFVHKPNRNSNNSHKEVQQMNTRKQESNSLDVNQLKLLFKTNEEFLNFLLSDKHLNELGLKLRFFIITQLESFICNGIFNTYRILPFGSSIAGFGTPNSDLDLVLMPPENVYLATDSYTRREERNKMKSKLRLIADLMQYSIPYYSHFVRILNARIPIIKFRFDLAPIDIDLSLELSPFSSGFFMSSCLSHCHQMNPCVRNLIQLLRIWAKQHGILKPQNWPNTKIFPGFTSFQLTSLAIHFLQRQDILPPIALFMNETQKNQKLVKEFDSIELLRQFFKFVLNFDFDSRGISILYANTIDKRTFDPIYIENPFELELNVCKNINDSQLDHFLTIVKLSLDRMDCQNCILADIFDINLIKSQRSKTKKKVNYVVNDLFIV